ncbi:MAG: beta-lactamase family protein [Anaerolineaceae bacterium]|nr:beta-lactamase family protein [Anaerolineaceae bacterium]
MNIARAEEYGFAPDRLALIRPSLQKYIDDGKIAGILSMVARRGKVVHFERMGWMDLASQKPIDFDTIFRIYSMSKPITSAAAMMLFEENRFHLNDPVSKYIPAFKNMKVIAHQEGDEVELVDAKREITICDLFTHSSGMSYGFDEKDYLDGLYRKNVWEMREKNPDATLEDLVNAVAQLPLRFHPGSAFHYSFSIDVLGYLVEVLSGMPFDRFLQERIFAPLGMLDTSFWVGPEKAQRLASMYGPDEKETGKLKDIDPNPESEYTRPVKFFSGGGGLVSTASDYLRFCQMLLNKGELDGVHLLGRKTVEFMFQNHLPAGVYLDQDPAKGFGLGGAVILDQVKTQMLGSNGLWWWGGAASTLFWIDPQEELIGLMMLQFMPGLYPLEMDFHNLVYQALI